MGNTGSSSCARLRTKSVRVRQWNVLIGPRMKRDAGACFVCWYQVLVYVILAWHISRRNQPAKSCGAWFSVSGPPGADLCCLIYLRCNFHADLECALSQQPLILSVSYCFSKFRGGLFPNGATIRKVEASEILRKIILLFASAATGYRSVRASLFHVFFSSHRALWTTRRIQ